MDREDFNTVIPLYLGYKTSMYPTEEINRVVSEYGQEYADRFSKYIEPILNDLDKFEHIEKSMSLIDAGKWARSKIKKSHPELSPEALDALEAIFMWWRR